MTTWIGVMAAVILSAAAGVSFVIQQVVNADLRAGIGSPAWAGFVSYLGGTVCMLSLALVLREAVPAVADIDRSHWWAWTGGFFGAVYIAISIFMVPRLGACFFVALLVVGQMVTSVALDHFGALGVSEHPLDIPRLIGAVLLVAVIRL